MNCKEEWQSVGTILFRPVTLLFLVLAIAGLTSPLYLEEKQKAVIYLFQISASIFAGILGGLVTDRYKEISGNTILSKKGISAVRGLALIRHKTRNIISRIKHTNNNDEVINLIDLLEKDIANVSREWDDIIPGITTGIDNYYDTLTAKEFELEQALNENEEVQAKLNEEKKSGQKINDDLMKLDSDHRNKINQLQKQISNLENNSVKISAHTKIGIPNLISNWNVDTAVLTPKQCSKCQQSYTSTYLIDAGLCPSCYAKSQAIGLINSVHLT